MTLQLLRLNDPRIRILEVQLQLGLSIVTGTSQLRELELPDDTSIRALVQRESRLPIQCQSTATLTRCRHSKRLSLEDKINLLKFPFLLDSPLLILTPNLITLVTIAVFQLFSIRNNSCLVSTLKYFGS